ncbi:MAG TPA: pyridoxal-phosphate dependent enzyme [Acidimicrobiales bacterium]|nr:pyridoxal-phosphate dependent enzyme [Acidimicrobiales bacterium]
MSSRLVCAGCGASPPAGAPFPFRCPNAGVGDVDHVLRRVLSPDLAFPRTAADDETPFVTYRTLLHSYDRALAGGMGDGEYVGLVRRLDLAVAEVDGAGFAATPLSRSDALSSALGFAPGGGVWVKDETGNVAGSHKARHLMGVMLHLEVAEQTGLSSPARRPDLAIASCGNAALAAGVVAAAAGWRLRVFVPVDADEAIVARLRSLGADVVACPRRPGERGDPAYLRLQEAIAQGALPFTCQGNENGLAIEGGETLGYEMVSAGPQFDHLVVQVGGGALATACIDAFAEAVALGALDRSPRAHTVQTTGAHPLERAYHRVASRVAAPGDIDAVVQEAAAHRSQYMWPWESEPKSIAEGILDDETYDWVAVVRGMLRTRGEPLVVSEDRLAEANDLGRAAGYAVSATGSAGLAGLLELRATGVVAPGERVAVLFTGVER